VWIGAALYALSFFLVATSDYSPQGSNSGLPGWVCAVYALFVPSWILVNGA
jgi:hypothetical protein